MRKIILMALAGLGIALAAPQVGSASPLMPSAGLATAADNVSTMQDVRWGRHPRWHHQSLAPTALAASPLAPMVIPSRVAALTLISDLVDRRWSAA